MNSHTCPECDKHLSDPTGCKSCGWIAPAKLSRNVRSESDGGCPFNEFGRTCGQPGSISHNLNGTGPWWCSKHFFKLSGRELGEPTEPMSYRARWYEKEGKPYEPPAVTSQALKRGI